jgi:predicted kinase
MKTLIICRGIPASGKSSWAIQWVENSKGERVRINRDDIRFMLFGRYIRVNETSVTRVQESIMRSAMSDGLDIVLDNTNLNDKHVRSVLDLASHYDYSVKYQDFPILLAEAIDRDRKRSRKVGEGVIADFYKRYTKSGELLPPPLYTKTSSDFVTYTPRKDADDAYLFDIDGTLAHLNPDNPRDIYDASRAHEDILDISVAKVLRDLSHWNKIIIMSGRSEDHRSETEHWLKMHVGEYELFMRPSGDVRKDSIVKHELFYKHIADKYNVRGVFDDRQQVVDMWREIGLKCFQVQPGDF